MSSNVLTLFYTRLLFSGRREMWQPSKGPVENGLFLLIVKNQWTGTKLDSKVNWLNAIIYFIMMPFKTLTLDHFETLWFCRSIEDSHCCRSPIYEPAAEENLWPLCQCSPLCINWRLQDPVCWCEPGHHQGEHWGRIQWHRTCGKSYQHISCVKYLF